MQLLLCVSYKLHLLELLNRLLLQYPIPFQEKDRDGCPKIVNLGSSKTDLFYEMKKYGFKKR